MMDRKQQIDRLHEELVKSPENKLVKLLNVFEISRYFFRKAYEDLKIESDKILKTPRYEMKRMDSQPEYFMEFMRLFYNYCTATSLLIDTTRVFIIDLKNNDIILDEKKLENEKKNRFDNFTCKCIKTLRNVFSHVQPPLLTITYDIKQNEAYIQLRKDKSSLLIETDKEVKKLFDTTDKPIDICQLVEEHHKIINNFHNWLNNEIKTELRENISDYEKKRLELLRLQNQEAIDRFCTNENFDIGKMIIESYDQAELKEKYEFIVAKRELTQQINFLIGVLLSKEIITLDQVRKVEQLLNRFYR